MDGDKLTLRMSSQMPSGVRNTLAEVLPGSSNGSVRVVVGDVGGGFGMKTGAYPEDIVLGWAALQAGRPEAIYFIERLFDAAARELGIDAAELRRRNMVRPEQMPYTNPMAQVYDSGRFEHILDQGLTLADWAGFATRRAAAASPPFWNGRAAMRWKRRSAWPSRPLAASS